MSKITYEPIAYFKSSHQQTYEAPRQGVLAESSAGTIELNEIFDRFCCEDLSGFERVWLVYDFHENKTWKPKVRPPRFSEIKRSVFSSRSPYRPNSIGISCVKLEKIDGTKIYISEHDLLDGTPILDIKPYLPYADSFPGVSTGWVRESSPYKVLFSGEADEKITWIEQSSGLSLKQIISNQLGYEPTHSKAKRVKCVSGNRYVFAIRTWRFEFILNEASLNVVSVYGSYSSGDLIKKDDPHGDKEIHRSFALKFDTDKKT